MSKAPMFQIESDGLRIGVAESEYFEPDQGAPRYEVRFRCPEGGPLQLNGRAVQDLVVSVGGEDRLEAVAAAFKQFIEAVQ